MNRRLFALLLMMLLMLLALSACGKNEIPEETIPGVVYTPDVNDGDLDNSGMEQAEPTSTESTAQTDAVTTENTENAKDVETSAATTPSTEPEEETSAPSTPVVQMTDYEWYNSLSGEEQMAFMESFDSVPAFFDWYNAAKAEYEELHPSIDIGDGVIDLGGLIGGDN